MIKELAKHGVKDVAVIGRRKEPLQALKSEYPSVNFLTIQGDVSKIDDLNKAIATISEEWGELDILINNAGVVSAGLLSEQSDEDMILLSK